MLNPDGVVNGNNRASLSGNNSFYFYFDFEFDVTINLYILSF